MASRDRHMDSKERLAIESVCIGMLKIIITMEETTPKVYSSLLTRKYSISNSRQQETALFDTSISNAESLKFTPKEVAIMLADQSNSDLLKRLDHAERSRILQRKVRQGLIVREYGIDEYVRPSMKRGRPSNRKEDCKETDLGGRRTLYSKNPLLQELQSALSRQHVREALIYELKLNGILLEFCRQVVLTKLYLIKCNSDDIICKAIGFKAIDQTRMVALRSRRQKVLKGSDDGLVQYAEQLSMKMKETILKDLLTRKTPQNGYIDKALALGFSILISRSWKE